MQDKEEKNGREVKENRKTYFVLEVLLLLMCGACNGRTHGVNFKRKNFEVQNSQNLNSRNSRKFRICRILFPSSSLIITLILRGKN